MDNNNNNPNFPASPTTNDINAAQQDAQQPAPVPTWLPTPPAPAQPMPPQPMPVPPTPPAAPEPTAWPATPVDHGTGSAVNSWAPPPPPNSAPTDSLNSAPQPFTSPSSPMPDPAASQPLNATQANPTWPPTTSAGPQTSAVASTPNWTPPADPPMPSPPSMPAAPEPTQPTSTGSVFPPQFSQSNQTVPTPTSFDPLAAAQPNPTPSFGSTPPTGSFGAPTNPDPTGFSTPQPPLSQPMDNSNAFVPPVDNSSSAPPQSPTVPDFLNNQPSPGGFNLGSTSPSTPTPTPDAQPTDLSGMGGAPSPAYTPPVTPDNAPVPPSGIPETMANANKPRLSRMVIIGAIIAALLVVASASYILFLGPKPGTPEDTISLPVSTSQEPLTKPKALNTPSPADVAATSSATPSEATSSGSSAFDLLKQAKTASPSPAAQ